VDVIYGDYAWIREDGDTFRIRHEIDFSPFVLLYHRVLYIPTTATFFRRRVFEQGNRLDESLHFALDFEFFLRLAAQRYRFLHVPAVLGEFRFHPCSKTCRSGEKQLKEKDRVMQLHSPLLRRLRSPVARQAALTLLRFCAATLRYSEKLVRGYYFNQFRLSTLNS
jgi:hypothetical protein